MTGSLTPSRSSSFASVNTNSSHNNTALLGAATAFGRPPQPPAALKNTYSGTNGALAAATTAGAAGRATGPNRGVSPSPQPKAVIPVGSPSVSQPSRKASSLSLKSNSGNLTVPHHDRSVHSRSPSQQAAALATARAPLTLLPLYQPPPTPTTSKSPVVAETGPPRPRSKTMQKPTIAPKPRRLSQQGEAIAAQTKKSADNMPLPSTSTLVNLFEKKAGSGAPLRRRRPDSLVIRPTTELSISSPKPIKPTEGLTSVFHLELDDEGGGVSSTMQKWPNSNERRIREHTSEESLSHRDNREHVSASPLSARRVQLPANRIDDPTEKAPVVASSLKPTSFTPSPPKSSNPTSRPMPIKQPPHSSNARSESFSGSVNSLTTIPGQFHQLYPRRMTPKMTGDELANALVASSLASSRAPSPTRLEPPPVPARKKKSHHSLLSFSRTPSPAKAGMLQTLRNHESSSSESEDGHHPYGKHRKRRLMRKHPNKHHEGDRRRWRDAVTERERRRYEGVWAANKGLHPPRAPDDGVLKRQHASADMTIDTIASKAAEQVSNVVVRDIWMRSRLPEPVLGVVWDLVDHDRSGQLQKEEFVVGLWLIDQRLKGRKLPVKVTESVWASVRGLQGIKIRKN